MNVYEVKVCADIGGELYDVRVNQHSVSEAWPDGRIALWVKGPRGMQMCVEANHGIEVLQDKRKPWADAVAGIAKAAVAMIRESGVA